MARKTNPELRERWRRRLQQQRDSGLTVAEFCRQEGLSSATFFAWKRKLPQELPAGTRSKSRRPATKRPQTVAGSTAHAGPEAAFVQLPLAPTRSTPWIELLLVDGTIIRLPQQNVTALETVLRTLRGDPGLLQHEEVRHA